MNTEKSISRKWHPEFEKYTKYITKHKVYEGLFYSITKNDTIQWVVTGKSEKGQKRRKWWDNQCKKNNIKIEAGCYAKIAVLIHPTKIHICQICGKGLSIQYIYPNSRTIKKIKTIFNFEMEPYEYNINEIIDLNKGRVSDWAELFKINSNINNVEDLKNWLRINHINKNSKSFLSPGVMSNSPDRFDGFHSDGNCCRSKSDKGRHKSNLQRYGQDRRVYENWADGNWKMADRLMSEFRKHNISADHIGPISLGFCHRPKFNPLTTSQNSSKNNRMSYDDVKILIEDENQGEKVVSWHSKFIWDKLKRKVVDDKTAVKLSNLMRINLHHVLIIFSMIDEKGFKQLLETFLNPKYSFFDYKFDGFNPKNGTFKNVKKIELNGKNQRNNIDRYYRIAFEKLKEYKDVNNRKTKIWNNKLVDSKLEDLFIDLQNRNLKLAKNKLDEIFKILAEQSFFLW